MNISVVQKEKNTFNSVNGCAYLPIYVEQYFTVIYADIWKIFNIVPKQNPCLMKSGEI